MRASNAGRVHGDQKPGTHRVAAGSIGRLDDIEGVIGPHQRAGRFNEFHGTVVAGHHNRSHCRHVTI